jgi:alkylation response protein AidB-like acyl-CoA dehydrogenase
MDLTPTPQENEFRAQVRDWLETHKPRGPRPVDAPGQRAFDLAWQRTQYEGGWAGISWPTEYGGRGLPLFHQIIWFEENARAGTPPVGSNAVGLNHGGPTLIARASEEQKAFHLPRILRGEVIWCQGFSEPSGGSDLAALRTRAVVEDDHLVVSGSKIWTSYAQIADYQELLVRTGTTESRHKGLTWVICDMRTPGIEVRPITTLIGDQHFNQVFYDQVRIPLGNIVGGLGNGWSVAMSTFGFERATAHVRDQLDLSMSFEKMVHWTRTHAAPNGRFPAIDNEEIAARLAMARAEISAMRALVYITGSRLRRTGEAGSEASIVRLHYAECKQRLARLAADLLGANGLERDSDAGFSAMDYFNSMRLTMGAGTAEIQRNIIGERILRLPRGK